MLKQKADDIKKLYNISPNKCINCNTALKYEKRNNKFCSNSCLATFNNALRNIARFKHSATIKKKISKTLKEKFIDRPIETKKCEVCDKEHTNNRKSCSDKYKRKLLSNSAKKNIQKIKNNRGRHKRSYLEQSFENWLNENNIKNYLIEYPLKNIELNKTYFADFYFPKLNLIIELDGTQHIKTVTQDYERDLYIKQHYGINVFRISHKEYIHKEKIEKVKELLNL